MNDIEFKSTFDEIEFNIAMKMYMKHNSKIASINEHLGEMYSYKDLGDAEILETYDTLQEYKKALKEKCDAFDKAVEYIKKEERIYEINKSSTELGCIDFIVNTNDFKNRIIDILTGEDNE